MGLSGDPVSPELGGEDWSLGIQLRGAVKKPLGTACVPL